MEDRKFFVRRDKNTPNESYGEVDQNIPNSYSLDDIIDPNLFQILSTQLSKFPRLLGYINNYVASPGELLTPSGLDKTYSDLDQDTHLKVEAITFLDLINIIELFYYGGDTNIIIKKFLSALHSNRVKALRTDSVVEPIADVPVPVFSKTNFRDVTPKDEPDSVYDFLSENRTVLAVYIFSLISLMFDLDLTLVKRR